MTLLFCYADGIPERTLLLMIYRKKVFMLLQFLKIHNILQNGIQKVHSTVYCKIYTNVEFYGKHSLKILLFVETKLYFSQGQNL